MRRSIIYGHPRAIVRKLSNMRAVVIDEAHLVVEWQVFDICLEQEKMRGQRGRLPVQALGYVNFRVAGNSGSAFPVTSASLHS